MRPAGRGSGGQIGQPQGHLLAIGMGVRASSTALPLITNNGIGAGLLYGVEASLAGHDHGKVSWLLSNVGQPPCPILAFAIPPVLVVKC